jgi:hypothetical protein
MMLKTSVAALAMAAALAGGCASNPARASSVVPLNVPEPPAREPVAPVPVAGAPVPVTAAPPPEATPTPPVGRTPQAPSASTPAAASAPPTTPAVTVPAAPPPDLRPAGPGPLTPTPARVVESLSRVKRKLESMDRQKLSAGKSADYDSAQRFLAQAGDAVKANNLLLAQSLAEKAEMLADGLR